MYLPLLSPVGKGGGAVRFTDPDCMSTFGGELTPALSTPPGDIKSEFRPSVGIGFDPLLVIEENDAGNVIMTLAALGLKNGPLIAGSGSVKSGVMPPVRLPNPGVAINMALQEQGGLAVQPAPAGHPFSDAREA